MNSTAFIILTVLFVQINSIYTQGGQVDPNCTEININCPEDSKNLNNQTIKCLRQANEPITFSCFSYQSWFKEPEILIGSSALNVINDKYRIHTCVDWQNKLRLPPTKQLLTIKSPDSTDIGYNSYYAKANGFNIFCFYNVFLFDNASTINVTFENFGSITQSADGVMLKETEIELDSFDNLLNYTFSIEAIPMNNLTVNDQMVEHESCRNNESSMPWLNCLKSQVLTFSPEKCQNTKVLEFSYKINNIEEYTSANIIPKKFKHSVKLSYPPQIKQQIVNLTYTDSDKNIILKCEVECSNPAVDNFEWYFSENETLIANTKTENEYVLTVDRQNKDTRIHCIAGNSVTKNTNNTKMSTTFFSIIYKPSTINRNALESWQIVLIVVSCFVLLFIIIGTILITMLIKKRKINLDFRKGSGNITQGISLEPSNNVDRKLQLHKEMIDNPIYGSSTSVMTSHSL